MAPDDDAQRPVRAGRRFAAAFLDIRSGWLAARGRRRVVLAQVREREDAPRDAATIPTDRPLSQILDALCDELDRRLSAPLLRPAPVRDPP